MMDDPTASSSTAENPDDTRHHVTAYLYGRITLEELCRRLEIEPAQARALAEGYAPEVMPLCLNCGNDHIRGAPDTWAAQMEQCRQQEAIEYEQEQPRNWLSEQDQGE